jgi:hypothetical protein
MLGNTKGGENILPSTIQTFVTVDFYNHDTRHGDLAEGFDPNYATQFSFKNGVDDFYLQYLEKNTMTMDFFLTRAHNALKLGSAKVPLSKLLEKETAFQVCEIVHEGVAGGDAYVLGKIFFKMRMRKPLDEALRWYSQKRALRQSRDPMTITSQ